MPVLSDLISSITNQRIATPGRKKFFQTTVPKPTTTERKEQFHALFGCTCAGGQYSDDENGGIFEPAYHAVFPADSEFLDPLNHLLRREAGEEEDWGGLSAQYLKWLQEDSLRHRRLINMTVPAFDPNSLHLDYGMVRKINRARTQCAGSQHMSELELAFG